MLQEQDIGRIAETVVGTTENIKDANEEIREVFYFIFGSPLAFLYKLCSVVRSFVCTQLGSYGMDLFHLLAGSSLQLANKNHYFKYKK